MFIELDKEALQSLGRNFVCYAVCVKNAAGFLDRDVAQVRTENLHAGRGGAITEVLQQDNRDGLSLFRRCAAGDPNS
jgi:hypothetical protein